MTESEYREQTNLTQKDVSHQVMTHCLRPIDFFADVGDKTHYTGEEVLNWLGY